MNKNIITVSDLSEIATISLDATLDYKTGEKAKNGEKYNLFGYNGLRFKLDTDHPFCKAFDNKKDLALVKLEEKEYERTVVDEEGVESVVTRKAFDLVGFATKGEVLSNRSFSAKLNAIDRLSDLSNASPETMKAFLETAI